MQKPSGEHDFQGFQLGAKQAHFQMQLRMGFQKLVGWEGGHSVSQGFMVSLIPLISQVTYNTLRVAPAPWGNPSASTYSEGTAPDTRGGPGTAKVPKGHKRQC